MKILFCIAIILTGFLTSQAQNETIILAQASAAVMIDGKIEENEWRDAFTRELSGGGKVFFKHDGEYFYVGVRGLKNGWSQLYLSEGESTDVYVLHASAALGMSVYNLDKNSLWQPANEFAWELRDRVINAETQKKMSDYLAKNFWVANNNNMNNKNEVEFQLKPRGAANKQFRVAVEYVTGEEKQFFPATLADDSLKSKLASGYTPPGLKFNHNQWAKISLENKKNQISALTADKTADAKSPAEVPERLFAAMREKNFEAIRALFIPEGQLIAIDKPRDGKGLSKMRVFKGDAFAKMIAEAKGAEFIEKMPQKEVEINGDFALVTGRYTFHVGEKFSHCGVNSFHLVKTDAGWKIANAASTLEFNCEQK